MHPQIEKTKFGSITINSEKIENDVIIRLDGEVKKRKKKLSKQVYGTSHIVSLDEAEYVYEEGANSLIFGTGQSGMAVLSAEAADFFREKSCQVKMLPTPEAVLVWNESEGAVIGLFHITC
jgi:hypothetical protein